MTQKAVVILQSPRSDLDLTKDLLAGEWNVSIVRGIDALVTWCEARPSATPVGLIVLDPLDAFDVRALEAAIARSSVATEWIAVIPREALRSSAIASFAVNVCYDFHTLPVEPERLLVVLGHAFGRSRIAHELALEDTESEGRFEMIGRSSAMQALYRQIEKMARSDAPVLVTGESGTGKEMVARALHKHSDRAAGPFVAVNCAAIPSELVQSELFGHERGAFTGAYQRHIGSVEAAHGGVLFLDEIGDLPLDQQAKLLRFLQERSIVRVGSNRPVATDVRVLAATHVDLAARIAEGRFREDLFYRLNVLHLHVPALRERGSDIELTARSILRRFLASYQRRSRGFSAAALEAMMTHAWPGNVRELINRVQKAVIMCDGRLISPTDLNLLDREPDSPGAKLSQARAEVERDVIERSLKRHLGNVSATARELGVSRVTLYRLMDKLRRASADDESHPASARPSETRP